MTLLGQELIDRVRAVAASKPDFVYQPETTGGSIDLKIGAGCVYVAHGRPSCIIGHALMWNGVVDSSIEGSIHNHEPVDVMIERTNLDVDAKESAWLSKVQVCQDGGASWGESVRVADAYIFVGAAS